MLATKSVNHELEDTQHLYRAIWPDPPPTRDHDSPSLHGSLVIVHIVVGVQKFVFEAS